MQTSITQRIWGIHLEWANATGSGPPADIAVGWEALGNLDELPATREAFKSMYMSVYPDEKPAAIPVKAGILFRFSKEMQVGDIVVYPSKLDRIVCIGVVDGDYEYLPSVSGAYPHRRKVTWKAMVPRAQISQPALYEIGSAITLFQINNNGEEFLSALKGEVFKTVDIKEVDDGNAADLSMQAAESVEDFIIKKLNNGMKAEQFEQFVAEVIRSLGYVARVTRYSGDGGVDIIAHKDQLGFEPPIIKAQCKQTLATIGGPDVQRLLGAIQPNEHALFVTLGNYSSDAIRIERNKSNLRLIGGGDLVQLILKNYEHFDAQYKSLLPLIRSYAPSALPLEIS